MIATSHQFASDGQLLNPQKIFVFYDHWKFLIRILLITFKINGVFSTSI